MKLLTILFGLLTTVSLHAAEGDVPPPHEQGFGQTLVMIAVALVFFYFIMWRPEQKRRKALETVRNELKKGDRVTAMGIIGTVSRVQEHTVILKMVDGSKIEFLKAAISEVVPGSDEDAKKVDKDDKNDKSSSSKRIDISDVE